LLSTPTQGPYLVRLELGASAVLIAIAGTWSAVRGLDLVGAMTPSLAATELDDADNMKFTVDFRSVYATILNKWLTGDARAVLGRDFEDVGFLG